MKLDLRKWKQTLLVQAICNDSAGRLHFAPASSQTADITAGNKAEVKGSILPVVATSSGSAKKSQAPSWSSISRTILGSSEEKQGTVHFGTRDMDVTAMVPGLTIEAEGVGNSKAEIDATKISFTRINSLSKSPKSSKSRPSQAAAQNAQSTANQGVSEAKHGPSRPRTPNSRPMRHVNRRKPPDPSGLSMPLPSRWSTSESLGSRPLQDRGRERCLL